MTIIARSDYDPNTLKELVEHLKKPGIKASMGNAGVGSASHLCGMLFQSETKAQVSTVPYRGTGPVMNDLIGKQIDLSCDQANQHYRSDHGQAGKGYAVHHQGAAEIAAGPAHRRRAGLKGFELGVWHGLFRAKGIAAGHRRKAVDHAPGRAQGPGSGEALQRHQHGTHVRRQGDAAAAERMLLSEIDRWAPDHQGLRQYAD